MKVNSTTSELVYNFINLYNTWVIWRSRNVEHTESLLENSDSGIPCFDHWNWNKIQYSNSNVIILNNITEAYNGGYNFKDLPNDKFYIIFSNGKWDSSICKLPFNYINHATYFVLSDYLDYYFNSKQYMFYTEKEYNFDYPKQFNFISTTGCNREERDTFIKILKSNYKSENYVLRYNGKDLGKVANYREEKFPKSGHLFAQTIKGLEKYYISVSHTLPIDLYNQGYYNLLSEGEIREIGSFNPSEKILKALLSGMPFVLVGSPKFLENLRNMGFKTYNKVWDESYDDILDYEQRMNSIVDLCNRLIDFDWEKNKNELKEIADYNRLQFLKMNIFFNRQFLKLQQKLQKLNI